jgi:PhnB protein
VSDDFDPLRQLRPDRIELDTPGDPALYTRAKDQLMSIVDQNLPLSATMATPDIYPRLAYRDELAAVDYLTRVFGFVENREARLEFDAKYLCWLRVGSGVVMVTHENADVHEIHSPLTAGLTTVIIHVYVHDIDTQHARAVEAGAHITMPLVDAFYGDRVYEATDPEGHRWHFGERFANIIARGGRPPEPD